MNAAHLHVMLNHLPILGVPFLALLLAWGLFRRSREVVILALWLSVGLAVATWGVFLTGEPAEEVVEDYAWADHDAIEEHEERANAALVLTLLAGVFAAAGLWQFRKDRPIAGPVPAGTLVMLAVAAALWGWTALAGGDIRHDEFGNGAADTRDRDRDRDDDHRE